jgi:hypothetical protein
LLVHFQDWDNQNRNAQMFLYDQDNSIIGSHKEGKWVSFKLIDPDEAVFKAQLLSVPNILITELALIPD